MSILTSGPISYPVNRPVMAAHKTKAGGKLIVLGSYTMFTDEYFDKEENAKIIDFILNYVSFDDFEGTPKVEKENEQEPERTIPDIAEMSEN